MRAAFLYFLALFAFLNGSITAAHGAGRYLPVSEAEQNVSALFQHQQAASALLLQPASVPQSAGASFDSVEFADDDDPELQPLLRTLAGFLSVYLPLPRRHLAAVYRQSLQSFSFLSTDRYIGLCTFRI
ncbi:MAG: hypothetical protein EOO08_04880 [Chitinophagaceae bacterium]|nr:MAG: hypothetical protein EOO08_04880 [Chitinophagaceae bacterium]